MGEMEQSMRMVEQALERMPGGAINVDFEGREVPVDAYVDRGKQGKTEGLLLLPIALSPNLQGQGRDAQARVNVHDKTVVLPPKETAYGSIEGLMNHFMLVMDGYAARPPARPTSPPRARTVSLDSTWSRTEATGRIACAAGHRVSLPWPHCRR